MSSTQAIFLARGAGVSLGLDPDTLEIVAKPKARITPQLRVAIEGNRDELVRDLILKAALAWVGERHVDGADLSEADVLEGELDRLYFEGNVEVFREAVRAWATSRARAYRKAAGRREG